MQNGIRLLRLTLPVLFVAFLVILGLSYTSNRRDDRSGDASRAVPPVRSNDKAQLVSYNFEDTQTIGGRVVSRIKAKQTVGFVSGWYELKDVVLTVYRESGTVYELAAPQAQFQVKSKEASLAGGVLVTSNDGLMVQTNEIRFDGNQLTNHMPVQFSIDRWKGQAGGVNVDVRQQMMRLSGQVTATLSPGSPGAGEPMTIEAREALFLRQQNRVNFDGDVTVRRRTDTVRSDKAFAQLDQNQKQLVALEGSGKVRAAMQGGLAAAAGTPSGGRKTLVAENFTTEFGPEGTIRALNVNGGPIPAQAVLDGPPVRTVTAQTFRALFEESQISELKAIGGMRLVESARTITARSGTVYFDRNTRQASSVVVDGDVRFVDPRLSGTSDRVNYDLVGGSVVLTAIPGGQPVVTTDGQTLKGDVISARLNEGVVRVTKNVSARIMPKSGGASASGTGVFPSAQVPVYVNSDTATLKRDGQTGYFKGNVRAWQDRNTLLGGDLLIQGQGDLIQSSDGVRLILYNTRGLQKSGPILGRGDKLMARKSEQKIDLTGNVQIDEEGRTLNAQQATFHFDNAHRIQKVESVGNVRLTESTTGRKGTGEAANYQVSDQIIILTGSPAVVTEPKGTLRGQQIVFDLARNKVDVRSGTNASENTYNPQ
ncbi:MAG: LPS export ABC transporter periplasmic protein LptC [Acidobacteriota bacterium]